MIDISTVNLIKEILIESLKKITIRWRRGTAAEWAAANPILKAGEVGYETDTGRHKVGDEVTPYLELTYPSYMTVAPTDASAVAEALQEHIVADNPHPTYDNGPSLVGLYRNAKV